MPHDELFHKKYAKERSLVKIIKKKWLKTLFDDPNIIAAGFGNRITQGEKSGEPAIIIYVARKIQKPFLTPSRLLPYRYYIGGDWIAVDVIETGPVYAFSFTARERPAPSGISVGHPAITAGTLGCLITDNTDKSLCILSNNHVLADENNANIGDPIIQPGAYDGGTTPKDDIADLKRFIPIDFSGNNTVDCAIAQVRTPNSDFVIDKIKNDLMPIPTKDHPAVGLLFAGSCNRTIMNPIDQVLAQLNIQFTSGSTTTVVADVDMNVEKVGRTTEYTTSTITEIDLTVNVGYDGGTATFVDQIATAWMSSGGDSGSVVCLGGKGGHEDRCGCISVSAAETILGVDLRKDEGLAKDFRDKYLRQTKIGRWAAELLHSNEDILLKRIEQQEIKEADKKFAQEIYKKYANDIRQIMVQPDVNIIISQKHLEDMESALRILKRYMSRDEAEAASELLALASKAKGKNTREVLTMLNDEDLFARVKEIISKVKSISEPSK